MKRLMGILVLVVLQLGSAVGWLVYGTKEMTPEQTDWRSELELSEEQMRMQRSLAMWYNLNLVSRGEGQPLEGYEQILFLENGQMGSIEFGQDQVVMPVWHGAGKRRAGGLTHLSRSSLPIGDQGDHTILTGDGTVLDGMQPPQKGQHFCIQVLGYRMTYRILDVKITKREPALPEMETGRSLCSIWIRRTGDWVIIRGGRVEE